MKICMITGSLPYMKCGVGDYTDKLCKSYVDSNIDLSVITTKGLNNSNKYKIYDVVRNWNYKDLKIIINKINEINPDIVHIQYPTKAYNKKTMINILPFFLHKRYKIVTTIHEYSDNSKLGKIRIWPNILFSDAVVVVDNEYIQDIKKVKILSYKRFYYINIGSNFDESNITEYERKKIRDKILKNNCNKIMGYFGFINKNKGLESILYSIYSLKEENKLKTIFIIIGELNKDDKYHRFIMQLIEELKLGNYIFTTGYLDEKEVGKYINSTDFMVLPFVNGLSVKNGSFIESMQEGRYIITTKRNGKKVFNEKNIFYLDKYDDVNKLSEIIYQKQNEKVFNYSVNSYDNFQWRNIANKYYKIYSEIL